MKIERNGRGFKCGEFIDRYGHKCSIQESSLATDDCIWLGIDDADPKMFATPEPNQHGIEPGSKVWIKYPLPEEVSLTTRMHLNKEQVASLIPILQHFVKTGYLPDEKQEKKDE